MNKWLIFTFFLIGIIGYLQQDTWHAIISMTLAHALAKQFDNIWIKVEIYAVGAITPISRMWERALWATDVVFGTVIAVLGVNSIDNYLNKANRYPDAYKNKISWRFTAGYNTVGLVGTF